MNYVVRSGSKANELRKVAVEMKFIALEISAKRLGERPWYHASHHLWFGRCFSFLSFFSSFALGLAHEELVEGCLFCLHFWCSRWPFLAVVLVNSAPQSGQLALVAWPDFSRWWRRRLLKVENWRPLHPCSQHWGLGLLWTTRTCPWLSCWWGAPPVCITGGIEYIIAGSWETGLLI